MDMATLAAQVLKVMQNMASFRKWLVEKVINPAIVKFFGAENAQNVADMLRKIADEQVDKALKGKTAEPIVKVGLDQRGFEGMLVVALQKPEIVQVLSANRSLVFAISQAMRESKEQAEKRRHEDIRAILAEIRGVTPDSVHENLVTSIYRSQVTARKRREDWSEAVQAELDRRETEMTANLNEIVTSSNRDGEEVQKWTSLMVDESVDAEPETIKAFLLEELEQNPKNLEKLKSQLKKKYLNELTAS